MPGFRPAGYQCEQDDLESTKVATESVCFCQCQCQIEEEEEEATTSEEIEAGMIDEGGNAGEGGEVPAGFQGSGSMTTVASSASVGPFFSIFRSFIVELLLLPNRGGWHPPSWFRALERRVEFAALVLKQSLWGGHVE